MYIFEFGEYYIKALEVNVLKFNKRDIFVLAIPIVIAAIAYGFLPPQIPRQFGFDGKVNSYMNKEFIFLLALLPYVVFKSHQIKHKK